MSDFLLQRFNDHQGLMGAVCEQKERSIAV
jgi:hypothetical protein